jgi:hypothetical protein
MTDMRHLTPDEFVELVDRVEGIVAEADVPHLATCERCRQQLAELRATLAMASEVEVPEPSPLFWDHFSSRVREAVATEGEPRHRWWPRLWSWPGVMAPISAVAASVVILGLVFRAPGPVPATPPVATVAVSMPRPVQASSTVDLLSDAVAADDPSLALVADLTDSLGWDAAADAGLASDGSAEHAVTHLSPVELQELERLLKEVLRPKGA